MGFAKGRWLLPLLLVGLAGCSLRPTAPLPATDTAAPATHWTVHGKLGVRSDNGRDSLHFHWQYAHPDYTLRLSAPIGGQQAVLHGHGDGVRLQLPDGSQRQAADADALLTEFYGWPVPVASLRWWLHGLPDPERHGQVSTDPDGQQRRLQQDGWQVHWSRYRDFHGHRMPARIDITAPAADLHLTLLIQDWQWP